MGQMPKVSQDSAAHMEDHGVAKDWHEDIAGYTVNFVEIREDMDLAPMLRELPDGRCHCPHWGYVFEGRLTWRFEDHEEVYEPGDAFYVPPGHTPRAEAGSRFVQFSPAEELREVDAAITRGLQAMQAG
jgi:Cupin domain